ncbi:MAG: hypothetical protein LBS65_08155 [Desulfovibrio sp.]|nr:hypothetical protein [Desulfovibrio sp.]
MKKIRLALFFFCVCAPPAQAQVAMRAIPVPDTVSREMQVLIGAGPFPFWDMHPKNTAEWKTFVEKVTAAGMAALPKLRELTGVTVEPGILAGVPVFTVTPRNVPSGNAGRVLLHFHGGGYALNPGEAGTGEAILFWPGNGKRDRMSRRNTKHFERRGETELLPQPPSQNRVDAVLT